MNFLHVVIEEALPYVISVLELIAILVITWSGLVAASHYFQNSFMKKHLDIQTDLAKGLVVGLEFAMAGEILKTILIQTMEEVYTLGGIIALRIALSLLIHFENRSHKPQHHEAVEQTGKTEDKKS